MQASKIQTSIIRVCVLLSHFYLGVESDTDHLCLTSASLYHIHEKRHGAPLACMCVKASVWL